MSTATITAPSKGYVSLNEAADYVGVSPRTIRRWIAQQHLPAYRPSPRALRLKLSDIDSFMESTATNRWAGDTRAK